MNGGQYWPFPPTSALFYRPSEPQLSQPGGSQPVLNTTQFASTVPQRTQSPIPFATSTPSPQSPAVSDSNVLAAGNKKGKKARVKSADWTEGETKDLLEAWGSRYSKLQGASQREKIKIWNEIYSSYNESHPQSQRTLQQVKKRQQNLEYEYEPLKQRSRSTGEAGIKKIKDGFPYFDIFEEVMGHRDDPSKMAIEGSSEDNDNASVVADGNLSFDDAEETSEEISVQRSSKKRKAEMQEKSGRKGKRRRRDVPAENKTTDWQTTFVEMWERSLEQDNARFERSAEMFQESQNRQMEQTNAILAGFKDIFKDFASK